MSEVTESSRDTHTSGALKGRHVLFMLIGFFGVMCVVNGIFLYHAITSFPGEQVPKSYLQGVNYNATLSARAAQTELGWQAEAGREGKDIVFRLYDRDGQALSQYKVSGELRRSASDAADIALKFKSFRPGEYRVSIATLAPGKWILNLDVQREDQSPVLFEASKTVYVP